MDPHALNIYTDGSAPKNPGTGGIGVRFIFPENYGSINQTKDFNFSGYIGGGIGLMEIVAIIQALKEALKLPNLNRIKRIVIHTDSQYVVDNYLRAIYAWPKSKWRKLDGSPVSNALHWKELVKLAQKLGLKGISVEIKKVQGHSSDIHNQAVDKMAKKSALNPITNISPSNIVRRKLTSNKTRRGSIKALGQKISISIVDSKYLSVQHEYSYRSEVLTKSSPFYGNVDFIFSTTPLRPGHKYFVVLNKNDSYIRIERVIREIKRKDTN